VPLHLERHLIQPRWPLWMALGSPVPWYGGGAATFVHRQSSRSQSPDGFIQAKKRLGRPEADAYYIAPSLESNADASHTWRALLEHLIAHAGEFGIQRLYACLPAQDEAAGLVAECGFVPYVRETLFRLVDAPAEQTSSLATFVRPQRETDSLALQRLADRFTPPVVLKAEGAYFKNKDANHTLIFQNWWRPGQAEGLVFDRNGMVEAAVILHRGNRGVWLRYLGDPMEHGVMEALVRQSLLQYQSNGLPIYCAVRSYQAALAVSLRNLGFEEVGELTRFVKHTTVSVQEPAASRTRLLIETSIPGIISTDIGASDPP